MFYEYHQNNSGGDFNLTDNLGVYVYIEAPNKEVADAIAITKGIYFDGVEKGHDCDCCGDRWYSGWGNGQETLAGYVDPARKFGIRNGVRWDGDRLGVVHYMDGRREDVLYGEDVIDSHEVRELEA